MANLPLQDVAAAFEPATARQSNTVALIALGVLYFMMGFITCLNDTLVPFFKAGFVLNYSQSSLVQFYFFLTYGIMSIPAGKIVERTGYKNGMVAGFAIAALGAFLFYPASLMHRYELFLVALFILAIGIVLLQVAANPYITILGPVETASSRLALIQGVGSAGTTIAPLFGAYFILSGLRQSAATSEAVRFPYIVIGLVLVCIACIVARLPLPVIRSSVAAAGRTRTPSGIFSFRNLNYGIIAIFLYVGAEVSIGSFLTNYIADTLHIDDAAANSYVSFYWGGMLIGRLTGSMVLKSVKPSAVLTILSVTAALLAGLSINTNGYVAVYSMIATGICNSVMFAVIFSLSVKGLGKYTPKASGLLSTAIAGGAIISFGQGFLKDMMNWQTAFLLPILCYIYIAFYGLKGYKA